MNEDKDRRNQPQLRFTRPQYNGLIKRAIEKGYLQPGDIGNRVKAKKKIERMILKELKVQEIPDESEGDEA